MISDSLIQTKFAGKDGFTWWIGKVARPEFWRDVETVQSQSGEKGHRVKVRIIGYHPWDTNELPEKDLPWAEVMSDPNVGNGTLSRGETMNLVGGETAVGFFLDGDDAQHPVIMGLLHRSANVKDTISESKAASRGAGLENTTPPSPSGDPDPPTTRPNPEALPVGMGRQGKTKPGRSKRGGGRAAADYLNLTIEQPRGTYTAAEFAAEKMGTKKITPATTCSDNYIGRITQVLQDFIALSNTLEKTLDVYVDPVLNEVVDMTYQIKKFAKRTMGIIKMVLNNVRNGLIAKLNLLFSKFLGFTKSIDPFSFLTGPLAQKGFMQILALIFCIFEKLIGELLKFLENLFETMLGRVINGPACAVEQFLQGILAKVMDSLEKGLEPILKGLDWLMGGLSKIKDVLSDVSSLATKIFNFIGCDGLKCTTPSSWISSINGSLEEKRDDWAKQVRGINVFRNANKELSNFERDADNATVNLFGNDEQYKNKTYRGSNLGSILADVDKLTGGESRKKFNKGLDSIEAALATSTLFGGENSIFNACNRGIHNPQTQDDMMPMPIGYQYDYCLPPKVKILGDGRGAKLRAIVGNRGEIFSIEVVREGRNYTKKGTSLIIVDNSGHGRGAQADPVVKGGKIKHVVITSSGSGYCPNVPYSDSNAEGPLGEVETTIDCSITADCPEGMECVNGRCVIPCDIDSDCPSGMECMNGICVPIPGGPGESEIGIPITCDIDSDCPPGMICMNGMCVPIPGEPGIGTDVVGIVTFIQPITPGIGYGPDDDIFIDDELCETCVLGISTGGSVISVELGIFSDKFKTQPLIRISSDTGVGANLIAVMEYERQYQTDFGSDTRRRLVGITSVVDCVGDPPQLVGYVNGREYYGPFHVDPETGAKMVGERHVSTTHAIIYPTKEQSLGGNTIQIVETESEDTQTQSVPVAGPSATTTTTVTPTPTPTPTPTTSPINTDTPTPSPDPGQGGGYGGGY